MTTAAEPLSPMHAMLDTVERVYDAHWANRVSNDPSVYQWVRGSALGPIDLTYVASMHNHVLLTGEHGFQLYAPHPTGLFEAHTSILPSGRGAWALSFVQACLHLMFTRTPAIEIFTRVPKGNLAARALARAIHGTYEATQERGWILDRDPIPADMFSLNLVNWARKAPGLVERGRWFHERLEAEYKRHNCADPSPHADDEIHDRNAGLAAEMFLGGMPQKGAIIYNRWAAIAGYAPVSVVSVDPVTVDIQDAVLVIPKSGDFFAATVRKPALPQAA